MEVREVRCPNCLAPVDGSRGVMTCRYCGTTLAMQGTNARIRESTLTLERIGPSIIQVIKVVKDFTGLGLAESKYLVESAPVVVAEWGESPRMIDFHAALVKVGAKARIDRR